MTDYTLPQFREAFGLSYKEAVEHNRVSNNGSTAIYSPSDKAVFETLLDEIDKLRKRVEELEQA